MGELRTAISINRLSFSYGKNVVLQNASAEIESGKLTVILGKNGSGKSTLLRIIAGLLPYSQGEISISDNNLSSLSLRQRSKIFGFLGQKHKAVFPFTVEQVVLTGRAGQVSFIPQKSDIESAVNAIEKVNISHLRNRIYTELSGGEQQLVMIARVLAQEPHILLLDEPTTHLDFCNQAKLLSLLRELTTQNLTVVTVLHDPNIAFLYGDDFIFVKNGTLDRPAEDTKPWSADYLKTVYKYELHALPYEGRALIVPDLKQSFDNDK
ncbi:MAG: ABC transporter ATP-binding protein [Bacteroidales bacterium]|jgi:iron complex transport system ATP-binding protein|nr:ABC transporter ATP-binding protein [Bacteroidales bacterium]MDD4214826.1 ABC transporter ATP-binding protein [Bacteroidales bacterium]